MLKALFDFLFVSCRHKYKIIHTIENKRIYNNGSIHVHGHTFIQECEKCGNINKVSTND